MKPLHWAALGAILIVVLVVYLTGGPTREHRAEPAPSTPREAARRLTGAPVRALPAFTLKVLGPDGSPTAARIRLTGREERHLEANRDGLVRAAELHPGIYNLIASKGRATASVAFELRRELDLGTLRLRAAVAIRGRVRDDQGKPVTGATVEAVEQERRGGLDFIGLIEQFTKPSGVAARARANEAGAYELIVGTGGSYALRAFAAGFCQEVLPTRAYAADAGGRDFTLYPGVAVSGRVMDDESRPVAGAQVQVNDAIAVFAGGLPRLVATDADGSFALTAAPSDQAVLTVRATGYATHFRKNLVLPATELTITLERGLTLRLRAVDSEHPGRPAPFVRVLVRREAAFAAGETDERGELRLENLPASDSGQGEIQFSGGGYIPHKIDFGDREPVGGILDLGEVPLEPGGVVRGRVLEKETKEPIAGARVRAMGGLKDLGLQLFGTTDAESGPDGSFELKGVSLGATMVLAEHPDYVSDTEPMALLMGMRGGGRPIFAEGSREAERDVLLAPGAVLEGLVLGPDGAPVSGATVKVEDTMAFFATLLGGGPSESQTDREGRFAIKGLRPGQAVELVARHGDFGASAPTAATAGTEATVRLTEPIRLTGRVVNEADEPVSGVRVIARHKKGEESGSYVEAYIVGAGAPRPSMTDREGRYLVPSAPQGDLTVSFHHSDYMTSKTEASIASGTTERNLGTTVLRRGPTIEGMVVDEKGAPVAEVRVQATLSGLTEPDAMPELREVGESIGHTTTDEKGRFSVHGLKQGHYDLTTQAKGRYGHLEGVATGTLDARIIHRGAGRLEGRVASGGRPVRGAKASATGRGIDQFAWARSDAEGKFTLEPLPPDLPFDLVIEHDGYLKVERKGAVASDTVQEFFLDPGIQVGGIVVEHDGTPAAMATVSIRVDGRPVKMVVAGRNGRFLAGGLPAGSLAVELVSGQGLPIFGSPGPGYVASGPVPVTPGNLAIRIVAEPGETIQGVVRNPDGSLADQVQVEALDADGKSVAKTWIWSGNGAFELKGLRRGAYAIRVSTLRPGGPGGELEGVETGRQKVEIRLSE